MSKEIKKVRFLQEIKMHMLLDDLYDMIENLAVQIMELDCELSEEDLIKIQRIRRYINTITEKIFEERS